MFLMAMRQTGCGHPVDPMASTWLNLLGLLLS